MTKEEAKAAIDLEYPVISQGIQYTKITAIIYRRRNGRAMVEVELLDKNKHSVTIADPKSVALV